jgi:large subunit ribosomal protein L10
LAISRSRKEELVTQYRQLLEASKGIVLTTYSGLTVREMQDLRGRIREAGGELCVVKNRLAQRAFKEADLSLPQGVLDGATAIGFAKEEFLGVAKAIVELSKESDFVRVKGGMMEGEIYSAAQVVQLAELPPLPVVQARLLGLLQAPAGRVVSALANSIRQVVNTLHAYAQSEVAGAAG